MKKHEISGFRRMRTITQLIFESFIQFVVQLQMLVYYQKHDQEEDDFGVGIVPLMTSLSLALAHGILEVI